VEGLSSARPGESKKPGEGLVCETSKSDWNENDQNLGKLKSVTMEKEIMVKKKQRSENKG